MSVLYFFLFNFLFSSIIDPVEIEIDKVSEKPSEITEKKTYSIKKISNLEGLVTQNETSLFKITRMNQKNLKEFFVEAKPYEGTLYLGKVFLVHRKDSNGYFSEVAKSFFIREELIDNKNYYKFSVFIKNHELLLNDELDFLGTPVNKSDLNKLNHALMDYLNLSRELGDLHFGSMSISFSYGLSSLKSKSSGPYDSNNVFYNPELGNMYSSDINESKNYTMYDTYNISYRWWFFFLSSMGLDLNYFFTPSIPTHIVNKDTGVKEIKSSDFKGYGISIMYRRRFFRMPAIFGLKYFIDSFSTDNNDDRLMSSTYSGVNANFTWNFPYKFTILPLPFTKMVFHNFEVGIGISPIVFVNDGIYSRGSRPNLISYRFHSGILFNFESEYLDFLKDFFFGLKYEFVNYDLKFLGATKPSNAMPDNTYSKEQYSYIGLQIKYEFKDIFGD